MVAINNRGYIVKSAKGKTERIALKQPDVWLIKACNYGGYIPCRNMYLPKEYIGKRVKMKIVLEEIATF